MRNLFILIVIIISGLLSSCIEKEPVVIIHTDFGDISLILYDETPLHKQNFLELVKGDFYDSTTFHRVIDGFMIQGGDPNSKDDDAFNDGMGSPGFTIPAELSPELTHIRGAVAAARQGSGNPEKKSNGSQFYIVENEEGYHPLDGDYTVFGLVIDGIEVVEEIAVQPKNSRNRPINDIMMTVEVKPMSKRKITKEFGYEFTE